MLGQDHVHLSLQNWRNHPAHSIMCWLRLYACAIAPESGMSFRESVCGRIESEPERKNEILRGISYLSIRSWRLLVCIGNIPTSQPQRPYPRFVSRLDFPRTHRNLNVGYFYKRRNQQGPERKYTHYQGRRRPRDHGWETLPEKQRKQMGRKDRKKEDSDSDFRRGIWPLTSI